MGTLESPRNELLAEDLVEELIKEAVCEEEEISTPVYRIVDDYVNSSENDEKIASLMEMNEELSLKLRETEAEKEKLLELQYIRDEIEAMNK